MQFVSSKSTTVAVALPSGIDSREAIVAVVDELTLRLTPRETHQLLDALPDPLHEILCACEARRGDERVHRMDRTVMLARIARRLHTTPAAAEAITTDVLHALRKELPPHVVDNVAAQLPRDIREVWLADPRQAPEEPMPSSRARDRVENEITQRASLPRGVCASAAFTAVMSALLERLSGGEALHVLIGLPEDLRPLLEGPALDRSEAPRTYDKHELVAVVARRLEIPAQVAASLVPAVLGATKQMLPRKEIDAVASQLPRDLRELWEAA